MSTQAERTPGPWEVSTGDVWEATIYSRNHVVAVCDGCGIPPGFRECGTDEAKANAHFIVTACNNHDVLLAACKNAAKALAALGISVNSRVLSQLQVAIKGATMGSPL